MKYIYWYIYDGSSPRFFELKADWYPSLSRLVDTVLAIKTVFLDVK